MLFRFVSAILHATDTNVQRVEILYMAHFDVLTQNGQQVWALHPRKHPATKNVGIWKQELKSVTDRPERPTIVDFQTTNDPHLTFQQNFGP